MNRSYLKQIIIITAFLSLLFGCAGIAEMEAPVDGASKSRANIPEPHLGAITKSGLQDTGLPESVASNPEFILLSFTDWENGHPVLRINQSAAMQMGIDSLSYQSFVNLL